MKGFTFAAAKNTIVPRLGQCLLAYTSNKQIGAGTKPFLVIGLSTRYVTLFYIPDLRPVKIRVNEWPHMAAKEKRPGSMANIRTLLVMAVDRYRKAHKKYNRQAVKMAFQVIDNVLGDNDNDLPGSDSGGRSADILAAWRRGGDREKG